MKALFSLLINHCIALLSNRERRRSEQLPSDGEMADRLAKLKGMPKGSVGPSKGKALQALYLNSTNV